MIEIISSYIRTIWWPRKLIVALPALACLYSVWTGYEIDLSAATKCESEILGSFRVMACLLVGFWLAFWSFERRAFVGYVEELIVQRKISLELKEDGDVYIKANGRRRGSLFGLSGFSIFYFFIVICTGYLSLSHSYADKFCAGKLVGFDAIGVPTLAVLIPIFTIGFSFFGFVLPWLLSLIHARERLIQHQKSAQVK